MHCMKCGQKIKDQQVFCEECLAIMDTYPVKPGTPIQLPTPSKNAPIMKSNRRKTKKPEEQILQLRTSVRWLSIILALSLLAILALVLMILWLLDGPSLALLAAQW